MEPVADTIRHYLDNRDMHFIFPSEVVAAFWRRRALSCTNRRAVRSDRFLSWDTFKEKTFARKREEVPANSFIRICFAADLLRRNAGDSGFLHNLILPEYAGSWRPFVRSIARMLPSLDGMLQDRQAAGLLDPGLREDLTTVAGRYRRFLEAHGFYEPLHETKRIVSPLEAIIFFPEVVFDFAEHERLLLRRNSVLVTDVGPPAAATAVLYPNARVEVRKTCLACRELLDGGAIPSEIAVTLTDWNGYAEEFCDAAARYDLPVTRRAGKPLADYVEVRLYRLLSECVASGFALEVLKELFLNAAYPWRDPGKGRELVRFGIDNYGVQNLPGNGPSMDEWHGRLKAAKKPQLLEFYSRFKRGAESITGASTFPDLRAAVMAFNRGFLDTGGFGESQSLPFSAAMDVLVRIEEPAARLDDLELDSPFSLWMTYLAERRYVEPGRGNGIRLYEYRVAAGICPDHHFILGVCQEASAVRQPAYPYLPLNMVGEDVQAQGDFTESFFRLYERSGRNVAFSGSKESFDGPVTPVRRFTYADPPAVENDLYASEIRFWAGADPLLPRVHRQQLAGLEYMASTGLREKGLDLTEQPLTRVALAGRISGRLTGSKGVLRISPSNLDIWRHCRFRYLLQRVLGIEEN
ncbi:MAG: hypothetical protein JW852_05385, partial [Spirochaetales bacterium]|nr:hypothetical protein [Spirochaetales bacterium]